MNNYWLPEGITLKSGQDENYTKYTKLIFIDSKYGEFESNFKNIQRVKKSTHPEAVKERKNNVDQNKALEKRKKTMLSLYNIDNSMKKEEFKVKLKKTNLEKYGVENAINNKDILNKKKETNKLRYGSESPLGNKEIQQKCIETNLIKYGTERSCQNEKIKEKIKETNLEKYGVENPLQSSIIKEKIKKTNLELYGFENPMQNSEIKEKIMKSMLNNGTVMSSKGERELLEYVKSLGIDCGPGYFGGSDPKQIDIKIKDLNIAIEFNGSYWHSEANKNIHKNYHLDKMNIAAKYGYKMLQFFDFEWDERQEQVKSFLRSALGKNDIKVYARKTQIIELDKKEAKDFLDKYHILGSCNFIKAFGLKYNDEMTCLATFSYNHRNPKKEFVLNRFVGKTNINVIGGLSKITSHAVKEFGCIKTWIDLRWSDGNNWFTGGWILEEQLRPDYFYYDTKNGKIISKQSRQKKKMKTPEGMTEYQHSLQDGLVRIFDCGKLRLRFEGKNVKI